MFWVVFNWRNDYEVSMRIFIRLERCKDKESKFYEEFWIWEVKVPFSDKVLSRFSKSYKLIISLLH